MHAYAYAMQMQCNYGAKHLRCYTGGRRPMAHDELTLGMASTGHILLGNHDVIHTNGSAPTTSFYPVQVDHVGSLDPMVEPCLEQRLRNQWNAAYQHAH
jgi:hypothetical protein